MFIKKRFSVFSSRFYAFGFKVWKKYSYDLNIFFSKKRRILRWFQIRWKSFFLNVPKTVISKNVTKSLSLFPLLLMFVKLVLVHFFKTFSTDLKSAWNYVFFIPFLIFFKKICLNGHICIFWNLTLKPNAQKTTPKIKKRIKYCKSVLDLNFAPIKGSVFLIF
jgi:hypothetical protein